MCDGCPIVVVESEGRKSDVLLCRVLNEPPIGSSELGIIGGGVLIVGVGGDTVNEG